MVDGKERGLPKPCRVLRALGKCASPDVRCGFPLGRKTKCFAGYEQDEGSVVHLLDMTLKLHDETSDDGRQKVPTFEHRSW